MRLTQKMLFNYSTVLSIWSYYQSTKSTWRTFARARTKRKMHSTLYFKISCSHYSLNKLWFSIWNWKLLFRWVNNSNVIKRTLVERRFQSTMLGKIIVASVVLPMRNWSNIDRTCSKSSVLKWKLILLMITMFQ